MSTPDEIVSVRANSEILSTDNTEYSIQCHPGTNPHCIPQYMISKTFLSAITISAGLSGLLFGYDTGVISSLLLSVHKDLSHRTLSVLDKSLISSSTSLFAFLINPFMAPISDVFGRRRVILLADAFFILGSLLQASTSSVWGMILGRSFIGLAVGSSSFASPLYISELAPAHSRGRLITILTLLITGGQVVAYIAGWLLSSLPNGWRWSVGLAALPALFQVLLILRMPETPRWLVMNQYYDQAELVLRKVHGPNLSNSPEYNSYIFNFIQNIRFDLANQSDSHHHSANDNHLPSHEPSVTTSLLSPPIDSFGSSQCTPCPQSRTYKTFAALSEQLSAFRHVKHYRRALSIACLLQGLQQLCGFNCIMYFSATIFAMVGFSSPIMVSLSIATTNFLFTLIALRLIDHVGRRRILLISVPFVCLSLTVCAVAFHSIHLILPEHASTANIPFMHQTITLNHILPARAYIILIALVLYVAAYALGLGNVPWQQSELFPLQVRSLGSAISTSVNWGCNFIIGISFMPSMELVSPSTTFAIYSSVCIIGWLAIWNIYPETKGLTLEEITSLLKTDHRT